MVNLLLGCKRMRESREITFIPRKVNLNIKGLLMAAEKFDYYFVNKIRPHPACKHGLFDYMFEIAKAGKLNAKQVDIFTRAMLARVFYTVPSICELAKQAAETGNYEALRTAVLNLREETADGDTKNMHPVLMERCFNEFRALFDLAPVKIIDCYNAPKFPEFITYIYTVAGLYKDHSILVSCVQEFASGGDNTEQMLGMMGDMYKLFRLYKENMKEEDFNENVRPYFAAHISLNEKSDQVLDGNAIELHHGIRARADVLSKLKTVDDVKKAKPYLLALCRDAQQEWVSNLLSQHLFNLLITIQFFQIANCSKC